MDSSAPPPEAVPADKTLSYEESGQPARPPSSPAELTRGATVDRYVVLDRVGEGGMGVVYAAYDPSLDRRVALKFLHAQDGGDGVREKRLLREAQAMARLSHPNVAVAYEVGIFHRHVFLAMEFVDGVDLRQWLSEGDRAFLEILEVFRAAGRGLAAAHAAGIVHRDFKPANVLVDRHGRPRVTDFGLSRHVPDLEDDASARADEPRAAALSSPSHLSMPLTRTGGVLGTPSYMSPEQGEGEVADARSDQFSFCVALYEAIYGERPVALEQAAVPAAVPAPAAASSVPRWCRRALMRGLSAAREERFPSMDALLAALTPPVTGKRPVVIAASIAVALASAAGLALAFTSDEEAAAPRCDLGAHRLAGVWDAPRKRQLEAAFLQSGAPGAEVVWKAFSEILDRRAGAWIAMNDAACTATHIDHVQSPAVLDLRVECLDRKRDEMKAVVDVFAGKLDTATLDRAVAAADKLGTVSACADVTNLRAVVPLPEDPSTRAKVRSVRKRLNGSRALYDAGQFTEGIEYMESIVREAAALDYAPLTAEATHALAFHLTRVRPAEAEKVLYDAANLAVKGRDWTLEAEILVTLVANYKREGRGSEGLVAARSAAMAVERAHGDDSLRARLANNTGMVETEGGHRAEALRRFEEAKAFLERASDTRSTRYAIVLFNMAERARVEGRTREAIGYLEGAQSIQRSLLRPDHPDHAFVLNFLGDAYLDLGQFERAAELYRRALEIVIREQGPDASQAILISRWLAHLESIAGNHDEARALFSRVLEAQQRSLSPGNLIALETYGFVAEASLRADRLADAERHLTLGMRLSEQTKQPVVTANNLAVLGALENRRGHFGQALRHCRRSLSQFSADMEVWSASMISLHECIGEALMGLRDPVAARKALEPAITSTLDLEKGPQWTSGAHFQLARALWETGEKTRALESASQTLTALRAAEGDNHRLIGLLEAWLRAHRPVKAEPHAHLE